MNCAVARTLEVVGDWWTLLILRNAFHGMRTFDAFQQQLGISSSVLSSRLKTLTEAGVLERRRSRDDRRSFEYRLTDCGLDLYPVLISLMEWGERWAADPRGRRLDLIEKATGQPVAGVAVLSADGRPLSARDVRPEAGPASDDQTRDLLSLRHRPAAS
ncbi:MAG: helix-turn-helix domain-containing protein [Pseudomonadota bacterium]|nr:helix-turn-helix domain-containing protein [Pseudomonadota bacterium]